MPKKIDLSSYFDPEFRKRELESFAKLPKRLSGQQGEPQADSFRQDHDRHFDKGKKIANNKKAIKAFLARLIFFMMLHPML